MLSLIAFSIQAAYAAIHGPNRAHNPHIVVPSSSEVHWFDKPGKMHTHCLIWTGKADISSERNSPGYETNLFGPLSSINIPGFHPTDIQTAYDIPSLHGAKAIAIVDAFAYPTAQADFNAFSTQFGLPTETSSDVTASTNQVLQVVYSAGTAPATVDRGWALEQSLDIEWAHAVAPNAKIYLVEAPDDSFDPNTFRINLFDAAALAATLPNVTQVSMSFGTADDYYEPYYDSNFNVPNVAFFASTGDSAGSIEYPSTSDYVVGVGGTSLTITNGYVQESVWNEEGGGQSLFSSLPTYQNFLSVNSQSYTRQVPDIAAVADPATPVAIYNSLINGWGVVGGTSVSSPILAAVYNVNSDINSYNYGSSTNLLTSIYSWISTYRFRDITAGYTYSGLYAARGFDNASGVGTPLVAPPTIVMPTNNFLCATPNGTITYNPFVPVDPVFPGHTLTSRVSAGPSWVSYDGTKITFTPPAGLKQGTYPFSLTTTTPGFPTDTVTKGYLVRVATPILQSSVWATTSVVSGSTDTLTLSLSNPAPLTGETISLTSSNPAVVPVPATVSLVNGQFSIPVVVTTGRVGKVAVTVTVTATFAGTKVPATVRVVPVSSGSSG
jgi:subtilase family serine protease